MLKRLDRNYATQEGEQASSESEPGQEQRPVDAQYFHSKEDEPELRSLEKELHARAEALGKVQNISTAPTANNNRRKIAEQITDTGTLEFVTLVDFIKKEHERHQQMKEPGQKAKILKLKSYERVKEKEFEKKEKQKGLQLNKAA